MRKYQAHPPTIFKYLKHLDTNGFREQIIPKGDEQNGFHINPHKPSDIAWGIKQVLQDKEKANLMGKNARKRVLDIFSWDSVAKRTLDIYKEFL